MGVVLDASFVYAAPVVRAIEARLRKPATAAKNTAVRVR